MSALIHKINKFNIFSKIPIITRLGIFSSKNKENMIKLGRWDYRISKRQEEIKSILNNIDHCGDHICGNPYQSKLYTDVLFDDIDNSYINKKINNNNYQNTDIELYCCELIGLQGPCSNCILRSNKCFNN
tara:strand:+ start:373 stop:762 length:390 start_codon:yes stop_codon:yes gene_type:complete